MSARRRTQWDRDGATTILAATEPASWVAVHDQAISVEWWNRALADGGIAAAPLTVTRDTGGNSVLRRLDVWKHTGDPLDLLWHTLAWGAGKHRRMCHRRIASVAADTRSAKARLKEAAAASANDPIAAYRLLYPNGRSALGGLGPAFGTKFLYFAGGDNPRHPSLILDQRVASKLGLPKWGCPPRPTARTANSWSSSGRQPARSQPHNGSWRCSRASDYQLAQTNVSPA